MWWCGAALVTVYVWVRGYEIGRLAAFAGLCWIVFMLSVDNANLPTDASRDLFLVIGAVSAWFVASIPRYMCHGA